jgi:hypothetical protein
MQTRIIKKTDLLRALFIWLVAVVMALLFYAWERPHIRNWQYTLHAKNGQPLPQQLIAKTNRGFGVYASEPAYQKHVFFVGDTATLGFVEAKGGHDSVRIPIYKLQRINAALDMRYLPDSLQGQPVYDVGALMPQRHSILPFAKRFVNWAGDGRLLLQSLLNPFTAIVCFLLLLALLLQKTVLQAARGVVLLPVSRMPSKQAVLLQWLLFVLVFALLLLQHPYYFLHDDNYAQFQPVINFSMREFYATGRLPVYNPYQLGGVPTLPQSIYALFYPFTHLSYLISVHLLGNEAHFTTVFCGLHLLMGYWFTLRLLRLLHINIVWATCAALCFVFSGAHLQFLSSWYYVAPAVAWLPAAALLTLQMQRQGRNRKNIFLLFAVFVLFAYSGNIQFCAYTLLFFLLYWWLSQPFQWKKFLFPLLLCAAVLLAFMPQWLIAFKVLNNVERMAGSQENLFLPLHKVVWPLANQFAAFSQPDSPRLQYEASFYNHQFAFSITAFAILFVFLLFRTHRVLFTPAYRALLICLLLALMLSLGKAGMVWPLLAKLPLFSKFQHPFKLLVFINFFVMLAGVPALRKFAHRYTPDLRKWLTVAVVYFSISPLFLSIVFWQHNFNRFASTKPYARQLWMDLLVKDAPWRILPIGRFTAPSEAATLQFNHGTQYRIPSLSGWEELNAITPDAFAHASAYGVRYFVLSNCAQYQLGPTIQMEEIYQTWQKKIMASGAGLRYKDSVITIYENPSWEPLLQIVTDSVRLAPPFAIRYTAQGATLQLDTMCQPGGRLTLGFINRPGLFVYLDGEKQVPQSDAAGRVWVLPKKPFQKVTLRYEPYAL